MTASEFHETQQSTKRKRAAAEAADRAEAERAAEQAFWDRAFLQVLGSYTGLEWRQTEAMKIHAAEKGITVKQYITECCTALADAALTARRARQQGDEGVTDREAQRASWVRGEMAMGESPRAALKQEGR